MGAYLDKPVKEKVSSNYENKFLKCGASSMQGWRVTQEDAHNCIMDFDTDSSFFAVYDGHGGHEVAEYTSHHLPDFIKSIDSYKRGEYELALKEAFLGFDAELATEPVVNKLKEIAESKKKEQQANEGSNSSDEEVNEEVDVKTLKKEAKMPLTELIALYANSELQKAKLAANKDKEQIPDSEVSSSSSTNNLSATSGEETKANGKCEKETNGEKTGDTGGCSSSNDDAVSSSSQVNGDINSASHSKSTPSDEGNGSAEDNLVTTSGERSSKKRAVINMYRTLLDDSYESDSDDNDESFRGADANLSSDDDNEENTNEENGAEEGEGESKEEEEEEEGEGDEEDDDEDDDDDDEDDDEDDDDEEGLAEIESVEAKDIRKKEEPGSDSGCTAVVCLVHRDTLYVANAGDSRAVLCRDGQAVDLSVDHKPDDEAEMKRIVGAGGEVTWEGRVNGGLNLSRALGDHLYKKASNLDATQQMITALPDIKIEKIDPLRDEFMILACDGIWNSMSSQEAVDFVRPLINNGEKLSTICEKMFDKCLAPGMHIVLCDGSGSDNMTCVIVQINKENKEIFGVTKRQSDSPLKEEGTGSKKVKLDCPSNKES